MAEIKTPKHFIGALVGDFTGASDRNVGLQRTCDLVDEWSTKFNATVQMQNDDGIERHYRVAAFSPEAENEAQLIHNLVWRINYAKEQGIAPVIQKTVAKLQAAGYSQKAIDEVVKS